MLLWHLGNGGDNQTVENCKGDSDTNCAWFNNSRGCKLSGITAGIWRFTLCYGATINGIHIESNLSNPTGQGTIIFDCSQAHVSGAVLRAGRTTQWNFEIHDQKADPYHSNVVFYGPCFDTNLLVSDGDIAIPPQIYITAINFNSRISGSGCSAIFDSQIFLTNSTPTVSPGFLTVGSAVAAVVAALATPRAQDALATGNFLLRQRGTVGTWEVTSSAVPGMAVLRKGTAIQWNVSANTAGTGYGTLLANTEYAYAAATMDALGNYGPLTNGANLTTPASGYSGANDVSPKVQGAPAILCVWRQAGVSTVTAPDHYVQLPCSGYEGRLYDTGSNISGIPWLTGGAIPALPVADASQDGIVIFDPISGTNYVLGTASQLPISQGGTGAATAAAALLALNGGGSIIGQQVEYATKTTNVTCSSNGVWVIMEDSGSSALSVTLPDDGLTYQVCLSFSGWEVVGGGGGSVGLGTSATNILKAQHGAAISASGAVGSPVILQNVVGSGQTISVYGFSPSTETVTVLGVAAGSSSQAGPIELAAYRVA
jgi:hypothetical protein